jgi:hypothetical protein
VFQALVEGLIGLAEFFEAEARSLRDGVMRMGLGLVLLVVAGVVLTLGVGLLLAGLYLYLLYYIRPYAAISVVGLLALLVAGGVLWAARRVAR